MIHVWSSGFDAFPSGQQFGSITGEALRRYKEAFKERMEVEHYFDEATPPEMYHLLGQCSVVEILDSETVATNSVDGALQITSNNALYRDNGSAMEVVTTADHGAREGLDDPTDHPQYVDATNGDAITGAHTIPKITGLPTTYGTPTDADALSKKQHSDDDAGGGANHANDVITSIDISVTGAKLKLTYSTASLTVSGSNYVREIDGYSSFPIPIAGTASFLVKGSTTDEDDYYMTLGFLTTTTNCEIGYHVFDDS